MAWSTKTTLEAIKRVRRAPDDPRSVLITLALEADTMGIIILLSADIPGLKNSGSPMIELVRAGNPRKTLQSLYLERGCLRLTLSMDIPDELRFFRVIGNRTISVKLPVT